jgi:hypothetical protein
MDALDNHGTLRHQHSVRSPVRDGRMAMVSISSHANATSIPTQHALVLHSKLRRLVYDKLFIVNGADSSMHEGSAAAYSMVSYLLCQHVNHFVTIFFTDLQCAFGPYTMSHKRYGMPTD